ncbi:hypothetical protein CC86DRAFT_296800 [Ophiobolus disseminans]|uniref:RNA polymerase I-specific transcription initiation factor rrn11 n=1 Tax=Ophiobolus disseminans TaxID=1469910 RepID=A0A6A6ZVJ4_9PLEO|nr:hypothetical protein CC86DRAFT_296800 [Ophiobolus disseminans]
MHFAPQETNGQQTTHSLRASQYRQVKKSRRGETQDESSSPEPELSTGPAPKARLYTAHASPEIAQLRAAGMVLEDELELPPPPFPHAHAKAVKNHYGPKQVQEEISKSPARLYAVSALSRVDSLNEQSQAISLKKTHLNVLSTVMHRCLVDEDYSRAGRAWGMLLRTQIAGGRPVDPRNHDRWGIGAETLLRRKPGLPLNDDPDPQALSQDMFSEEGFELAREYYERLIIQYPYRKLSPHAVDERTFYPAMFSLWIFEITEKSKRDPRARENAIQVEELARAMEISERLDQLIASPPFDKQASLLDLRGQLSLWTSVLLEGRLDDGEDWDMDATDRSLESSVSATNVRYSKRSSFFRGPKRTEPPGKPQPFRALTSNSKK